MGASVVLPEWVGYVACLWSSFAFGSNFVPVKQYDAKDGVFFQWILCSAVWIVGFIVNAIRGFPDFQPFAMLGGFLWCTGNMTAVPIIRCIGLSLGMLLWGLSNLLTGWGTATFGLFGLKQEHVSVPWLNYLAAVFAIISGALFAFIKPEDSKKEENQDPEKEFMINHGDTFNETPTGFSIDSLSINQKRVVGISLSIIAGMLYGSNFTPPQWIMDNCKNGCSQNGLDYVFSHFCGIYITSTLYFMAYCGIMSNKPVVLPEIILPAFVSGFLWATAQVGYFLANSTISIVVSFPILSTLPGAIASLWGILVFKEIQGRRNYIFFGLAFVTVIGCVTTVVLSKAL